MDKVITPEEWAKNKDPHNSAATGLVAWATVLLVVGAVMLLLGLTDRSMNWGVIVGPALIGLGVQMFIGLSMFWAWRFERRQLSWPSNLPPPVTH